MADSTPDPQKWWQQEIPDDLKIARDFADDPDLARAYARSALNHLWDLNRDRGEAGVLAMLDKLDRDGLVRLVVSAVDRLDERNFVDALPENPA